MYFELLELIMDNADDYVSGVRDFFAGAALTLEAAEPRTGRRVRRAQRGGDERAGDGGDRGGEPARTGAGAAGERDGEDERPGGDGGEHDIGEREQLPAGPRLR